MQFNDIAITHRLRASFAVSVSVICWKAILLAVLSVLVEDNVGVGSTL
jgi:hypothetical protein